MARRLTWRPRLSDHVGLVSRKSSGDRVGDTKSDTSDSSMTREAEVGIGPEPSFGAWLQRRRKQLDLTQAHLGQRVGCAAVTLHKIETGQLRPSRERPSGLRTSSHWRVRNEMRSSSRHARTGATGGGHSQTTEERLHKLRFPSRSAASSAANEKSRKSSALSGKPDLSR